MFASWWESYDNHRKSVEKQRHHSANKDLYSQGYGLSSGHVRLWRPDHRGWHTKELMPLNCGAGEGSLESLGQQGDQTSQSERKLTLNTHWKDWCWSWSSCILVTWGKQLTQRKSPWCWEDWGQKEKRVSEDEMTRWHHQCNGHELEQTPGDGEGQGGLASCIPWGLQRVRHD